MTNFGLTIPEATDFGAFNSYKPVDPIPASRYGLLPQLGWFQGNACVPISITNALAGMADWHETPELLIDGSNKHDSLIRTFLKMSEYVGTTNAGSNAINAYNGLNDYLISRKLESDFAVQIEDNFKTLDSENSITKSQINYFQSLISASAKGPVIFMDYYANIRGGHALTGVSLEINDKNNNMIIDKGEAYAYVIDPLDPASNYSPETFITSGLTTEEANDLWNRTIKPASGSTPNLKKVEIYQDFSRITSSTDKTVQGGLTFNYDQTMVEISKLENQVYEPKQSPSNFSEGTLYHFIGLHRSSLPDDISDIISDKITDNQIIYDLSDELINNQVEGTFFVYLDESSASENDLSFYQLADTSGSIIDPVTGERLKPGNANYLSTALELSKQFDASDANSDDDDLADRLSADNAQIGNFSFKLNSVNETALFAPIVTTSDGNIWTTFSSANLDGKNHFQSVGGLSFQLEDQFDLGDADYNDLQVILTPLEINGVA